MARPTVLAGTGHRPPRLGLDYSKASQNLLFEFVRGELDRAMVSSVLSGMAAGFDQALAKAALDLGVPLVAAVPFDGQELKWPQEAQDEYRGILSRASEVVVVCAGGYASWKFAERDRWLVDHADVLMALYDGKPKSGTAITVGYAEQKGVPVWNLWGCWEEFKRERS